MTRRIVGSSAIAAAQEQGEKGQLMGMGGQLAAAGVAHFGEEEAIALVAQASPAVELSPGQMSAGSRSKGLNAARHAGV